MKTIYEQGPRFARSILGELERLPKVRLSHAARLYSDQDSARWSDSDPED